jgi:hypothetical protein
MELKVKKAFKKYRLTEDLLHTFQYCDILVLLVQYIGRHEHGVQLHRHATHQIQINDVSQRFYINCRDI